MPLSTITGNFPVDIYRNIKNRDFFPVFTRDFSFQYD